MRRHVTVGGTAAFREASIGATVLRCTCGDPATHPAMPCTQAREEPLGIVSYTNRNPFRQWWWDIKKAWKEGRQ